MRDPITAMDLHTVGLWYRVDDIDQAFAFKYFDWLCASDNNDLLNVSKGLCCVYLVFPKRHHRRGRV